MASPNTIQRNGRADWTLMTTIHAALRCDLDQLLHTTAGRTVPGRAGGYSATSCACTSPLSRRPCGPWPGSNSPATLTARP
jgi:hypothetical protein